MKWIATAAFGLDGMTARDLKYLGMEEVHVLPSGGAEFTGTWRDAFRANLWLRTAERIMLVAGRFPARTWDEFFRGVNAVPWENLLGEDAAFPVRAKCVKSMLMSPSDAQKLTKRAVADRLGRVFGYDRAPETGALYQIDVSIREDTVTVCLDTSGDALSKRGYRTWNGEAPLRETLAAALVLGSGWHPKMPLYDPCCGTGTLLIEAAFIALNRAPGLLRNFALENWPTADSSSFEEERRAAKSRYDKCYDRPLNIAGSDIDPEAIELARRHVKQAGLGERIALEVKDLREVTRQGPAGVFIANPPYGERIDNIRAAHAVAKQLGELQRRNPGWDLCAFSADMGFEREYGRRASRRKRYYNGPIECEYHIFEAGMPRSGRREEK